MLCFFNKRLYQPNFPTFAFAYTEGSSPIMEKQLSDKNATQQWARHLAREYLATGGQLPTLGATKATAIREFGRREIAIRELRYSESVLPGRASDCRVNACHGFLIFHDAKGESSAWLYAMASKTSGPSRLPCQVFHFGRLVKVGSLATAKAFAKTIRDGIKAA